jgi:hypothetical protein
MSTQTTKQFESLRVSPEMLNEFNKHYSPDFTASQPAMAASQAKKIITL